MTGINNAYILIGGNMGNRQASLRAATGMVEAELGSILQRSSLYETAAWGIQTQSPFLNQVLLIQTTSQPIDLLKALLNIEQKMGRFREKKYGPRSIDLDILFYNDWIIDIPGLQIPHPRIAERRFALTPMSELSPNYKHPVFNKTMRELLETCADQLPVQKLTDTVQNKA